MPNTIQDLLDNIENARYGADVRSSIHDAIEMCYDNTATGKTTAEAAAQSATSSVNEALASLTTLSGNVTTAIGNAEQATSDAQSAAARAGLAADSIESAISTAEDAANTANTAVANLTTLQASVTAAVTNANNAVANANSALNTVTTTMAGVSSAVSSANTAASEASAATSSAVLAASDANAARSACLTATSGATTATTSANVAAGRAEAAANAIDDLTVSSEDVGPDGTMQVTVTTVDDHKNFHFRLKQGQPGTSYVIKGSAYETVADLEADITNPAVGDQYNVGTTAPYNVYRWTGEDWEDQGQIGFSINNLSNSEIDTLWNETAISGSGSKYMNQTGFLYLIVNKIKAALSNKVDKVSGKALSTNDFTTAYKNLIDTHTSQISTLDSGKVDKESGKVLSSNDFTNAYKSKIDANENSITALQTTINANKPTSFTVTLSASAWSNKVLTVSDARFVSTGYVYWVAAAGSSRNAYVDADIYADDVTTTGQITFHCDSVPSVDLTANVIRMVSA